MMMESWIHGSFFDAWLHVGAIVAGVSLLSTALGLVLERGFGPGRKIWDIAIPDVQTPREKRAYAGFVVLLTTLATFALRADLVDFGPSGATAIAATFAVYWVLFEVYYYGLHRALHTRPLYRFHAYHHASHVTTPWSGQSLGVIEALGWIFGLLFPPVLMSFFMQVSPAGVLVYFVANTFVNLVGHANVELSPFPQRAATWLTHPWIYHALHHARFRHHYSFASSFMDRLCGTEWSDWPALHARIVSGRPLSRLSARADEPNT